MGFGYDKIPFLSGHSTPKGTRWSEDQPLHFIIQRAQIGSEDELNNESETEEAE